MSYAASTNVSTENSRAEIERTLRRYKADAFGYGQDGDRATIMFRINGRMIRFSLTLPDPKARVFTHHSRGLRTAESAEREWEQSCRQKWRALALVIKAKLEAVSAGITTVEDEFLAHTMLSDGTTVGDTVRPMVEENYQIGGPPRLMLSGPNQ